LSFFLSSLLSLFFQDEEIYATQKVLDSSGFPMPNFGNLGVSLRAELHELDHDNTGAKTPELVLGEEESDEDDPSNTIEHGMYTFFARYICF
jgi:hypothetical protein